MVDLSIRLLDIASDVTSVAPESTSSIEDTQYGIEVCRECIQSCMSSEMCDKVQAIDLCVEIGDEISDHMCRTTLRMGQGITCECACNAFTGRNIEKVREEWFV